MEMLYFVIFGCLLFTANSLPLADDEPQSTKTSKTLTTTNTEMKTLENDGPNDGRLSSFDTFKVDDIPSIKEIQSNDISDNKVLTRKKRAPRPVNESVSLVYPACIVFFVLAGLWMCGILMACIMVCIAGPKAAAASMRRQGGGD